jgi:hypothetical protein
MFEYEQKKLGQNFSFSGIKFCPPGTVLAFSFPAGLPLSYSGSGL